MASEVSFKIELSKKNWLQAKTLYKDELPAHVFLRDFRGP